MPLFRSQLIVDIEDQDTVNAHTWYLTARGYPAATIDGKPVYLHKLIAPYISFCDHKNGNKLDARKENLREATQQQNNFNLSKRSDNTSGYKGVSKKRNKWRAYIVWNGTQYSLGVFVTAKEAALAYNEAAKKYFGEFAKLNEVDNET